MTDTFTQNELLENTSRLVAAYIAQHKTSLEELPHIITHMYHALLNMRTMPDGLSLRKDPAVRIEDSVTDDYLICLEDGKKLHMLKRHLSSKYGMSLDQYKQRWNLPNDYPTVSPSYARRRSNIALTTGLGKSGRGKAKLKAA